VHLRLLVAVSVVAWLGQGVLVDRVRLLANKEGMGKIILESDKAPKAVGPYAQGVKLDNLIFTAGQIPLNPANGEIVGSNAEEQTRQVLTNLQAVLAAGGASLTSVLKTTVFLTDLQDFAAMNKVYAEFFSAPYPARSTIQVTALPKGAKVEIEAVAATE
jgi:2-iminobutanoate/2-iminopropanoate deaminase